MMVKKIRLSLIAVALISCSFVSDKPALALYPALSKYIQHSIKDFDNIPEDRKSVLRDIALYADKKLNADEKVNLIFICTHNSRRSHFSQVWSHLASRYYGIKSIHTYSGGTHATAFNPRAVDALRRAGFQAEKPKEEVNPIYQLKYNDSDLPIYTFSKKYSDASNPQENFCAVMTCSQADKSCPIIPGSTLRVSLPYEDPKTFDGTAEEQERYDERCKQISIEMFYLFSLIKSRQ